MQKFDLLANLPNCAFLSIRISLLNKAAITEAPFGFNLKLVVASSIEIFTVQNA